MEAPLAGVRILDFSRQLAGAAGTRYLANLGAEVLRVEWPEPPGLDFVRLLMPADGIEGANRGAMFNALNVDKRSFTLNMATDEGRQLARRLVRISDVVYENMTPRVMRNWGLDDAALRKLRPDIINVSCSGFGQTGPSSGYRSYGSPSAAHTGIAHLAGLPGLPPAGWGFQIGDTHAAINNAMTVMMALHYRRASGRGVYIDSAQTQVNTTLLHKLFLDYFVNGTKTRTPGYPPGNDRTEPRVAPYNTYPCLGHDTWCAVTVLSDDEWRALRQVMGDPEWARSDDYARSEDRWERRRTLDEHLARWTRSFERHSLARLLQAAGVRAAVVEDVRDRLDWDPQLAHRGTFALYEHPEVGPRRHETIGFHLSRWQYTPWRAAPRLGEDNDYVFRELLGMNEEELARLEAAEVVRMPERTERSNSPRQSSAVATTVTFPDARRGDPDRGVGALSNVLVIELGDEGVQYAGKLLADMGATVVKIEPVGGAAARRRGPFLEGRFDCNASIGFWASNTNKHSVVCDLSDPDSRAWLDTLIGRADVLLDDSTPGALEPLGLDYESIARCNPRLVYASVTPFGQSGPRAHWKGSDLVYWASGGAAAMLGYSDHTTRPLVPQGDISFQLAGQWAVIGTLAALAARDRDDTGQHVDISLQEAVAFVVDGYATAPYEYMGVTVRRKDFAKLVPTGDDRYLMAQMLNISEERWTAFRDWLVANGEGAALSAIPPAEFEHNEGALMEAVGGVAATRSAAELVELGQSFGFTWMAVNAPEDLADDPQLEFRQFFRSVEHPELGTEYRYAGPGAEWSEAGWSIRRRAPVLGEDNERWGLTAARSSLCD